MIRIAQKMRPFSHAPNTTCLIPGTSFLVQAFPALLRIKEFSGATLKEVELPIKGPLQQFTVMQDLERGCVTLFSERYCLHVLPNLEVVFKKNPGLAPFHVKEMLSLGSHKKQEWEAIKKRGDFREIFPLWFRLGASLKMEQPESQVKNMALGEMFSLLEGCKLAIQSNHPEMILPTFRKLFLAGFGHFFVPRLIDEEFQGILPVEVDVSPVSPLPLLVESAKLIRSLFFRCESNHVFILPHLPPEFFSGRMIHLTCDSWGTCDLEWSKKCIKKVHLHASQDGNVNLHFHPSLRTFRLRRRKSDSGKILRCGDSLEIKSGEHYLLDQFKK